MNIGVVGVGYVGLVTGACLAQLGHRVTCVDVDERKIERLQKGEVPIHEAGLPELVAKNVREKRLRFTTRLAETVTGVELVFLAVGTPAGHDGGADLRALRAVAAEIGRVVAHPIVVVQKSTAPVGTAPVLEGIIARELRRRGLQMDVPVVVNPEFLREGSAVNDFMRPDRVVIGSTDAAGQSVASLYAPLLPPERIFLMDRASAEMTKYAANAFLVTKISFINEIANLCEATGADVEHVRRGIGADVRIGAHFLAAGLGYGGSCFPKDSRALIHTGRDLGRPLQILEAAERVNELQRRQVIEKVVAGIGSPRTPSGRLAGHRVAVWGLAFKPGTDDLRDAPAITVIEGLLEHAAAVRAYDPVAMDNARRIFGERIEYARDPYQCADDSDAVVLVTEWPEFRESDLARVRARMRGRLLIDGRNALDPEVAVALGFVYHGVGRPPRGVPNGEEDVRVGVATAARAPLVAAVEAAGN